MSHQDVIKISVNPHYLPFLTKQTADLCTLAVMQDGLLLEQVQEQTLPICTVAVNQNPAAFKYVKTQCRTICHVALMADGMNLRLIDKQTREHCILAVVQNPMAIQFVRPDLLTPDLCFIAIVKDHRVFPHIPLAFRNREVCRTAVKNFMEDIIIGSPKPLVNVVDMVHEICVEALLDLIEEYPQIIQWIENPDERLCVQAVRSDFSVAQFVKNPSDELKSVLNEMDSDKMSLSEFIFQGWKVALRDDPCRIKDFTTNICTKARLIRNDREKIKELNKGCEMVFRHMRQTNPYLFHFMKGMQMPNTFQEVVNVMANEFQFPSCQAPGNTSLAHLRRHPADIRCAENQTLDMCRLASHVDPRVVVFIRDPVMRREVASFTRRMNLIKRQ